MEWGSLATWAGLAWAVLMVAVGSILFVVRQSTQHDKDLAAAEAALRREFALAVDGIKAVESKARHDIRAECMNAQAGITLEVRALQREAVRREEHNALETRLGQGLSKLETKVDRLAEAVGNLGNIGKAVERLEEKIDRFVDNGGARRAQ